MATMAKRKKSLKIKRNQLYVSKYQITDNKTFALFSNNNEKVIDNFDNPTIINSKFTENDLSMIIDRERVLNYIREKGDNKVTFDGYGEVPFEIVQLFRKIATNLKFCPITKWFDQEVNNLMAVIPINPQYKPIGMFILNRKEN